MVVQTDHQTSPIRWPDLSTGTLIRAVWRGRSQLIAVVSLFAGLGTAVAFLMPPEFISEARIMPEMGSSSGDVFKRLASVAGFSGIDMADDEVIDAIRPDLYPSVLQSTPFLLYLIGQTVTTTAGTKATMGTVLMPGKGANWSWQRLLAANEPADEQPPKATTRGPVKLSKRQQELVEDIGKRVSARLDTRSGVISISAKMPDAAVAAAVAQLAMDYLTQYVTNYRTEKARLDLHFYAKRLDEARRRYQRLQFSVFQYGDQHKYVVVQATTMEKQRLEAELGIAQTVYTELSRQFEQAKLKVQERTPVFKVLEPAQVPLERVSPKRTVLVLLCALAGLLAGIGYLMAKQNDLVGRLRGMLVHTD